MAKSKIKGLEKLTKKMLAIGPEALKKLEGVVLKQAQEAAESARNLAPKGKTGNLKASIGAVLGEAPPTTGRRKSRGNKGSKEENSVVKATVYAGDDKAWYAALIEFGVPPHPQGGRFEGTQHPGTPPRPFFFPAYRSKRKTAKSRITRAIRQTIKEVAKR